MTSISRPPDESQAGRRSPAPTWTSSACGMRSSLPPGRQAFSYQAYSCREGAYLPPHLLGPAPLVIVEGSYSHHPSLAPYYDIRIFVTCSPDEQARRLRKREGERYSNFVERWIPLEEGYFANYSIEENAEMMVVTD